MKKHSRLLICVFLIFLIPATALRAQGGAVFENLSLESVIMKRKMNYALYLPPGYHHATRSYPVLYFLHGMNENHTAWLRSGQLKQTLDALIQSGKLKPLIVIMPDAGMSYYMNSVSGQPAYESYFFDEFMPYVEDIYRVSKGKQNRSIGGFSMGGYGALLYALRKPELFRTCLAFSPGVRTDEEINALSERDYNMRYRIALGEYKANEERATPYYQVHYSVLNLVLNLPDKEKKAVRFYVDCGDDDFLYKGNSYLHIMMRDGGFRHEYRVRDGGHTWAYWRGGLRDALLFLDL